MSILEWTGNALADVGIAALCAMSGRRSPRELSISDLDRAAEEMRDVYFSGAWISYLTCVFPNAEYVQPGDVDKKADARAAYFDRVLLAHRRTEAESEALGLRCLLSGLPATHLVNRVQIPLITGRSVLNFFPNGIAGFPIAGPYLTAIQAIPFGGRRADGKLLCVSADSPDLMISFAQRYVRDNRRLIGLAQAAEQWDGPRLELPREHAKKDKMPQVRWPRTLILEDLMGALSEQRTESEGDGFGSALVHWLSNYGKGASVEIYEIPAQLVQLLRRLTSPEIETLWKRLVESGWLRQRSKLGKNAESELPARAGRSKNAVLEDLLAIYRDGGLNPVAASAFLRRHLAGILYVKANGMIRAVVWPLIEIFLQELFGMSPKRIAAIKDFADRLVSSIKRSGRTKLILDLSFAKRSWEFRSLLVKELRRDFTTHDDLLFTLENYLSLFEDDEGTGLADWGITRDLLLIRLFQRSHELQLDLEEFVDEIEKREPDEDGDRNLVGAASESD